ncbi:MAG: LemA family protein [Candidatus Omnitrophota bacterium]|jgi:LemA protein
MPVISILLIVAVVAAFWLVIIFNGLVRLKVRVANGWSQIDVQLKRRHDLIPNLVETARGYMKFERDTLENVTKARTQATQATTVKDKEGAENMLTGALRSLFAVAEKYPELKAGQNMIALQEELASTENRISSARQFYNDEVARYNTAVKTFPANTIAPALGFTAAEFFELKDLAQKEPPKVDFA